MKLTPDKEIRSFPPQLLLLNIEYFHRLFMPKTLVNCTELWQISHVHIFQS